MSKLAPGADRIETGGQHLIRAYCAAQRDCRIDMTSVSVYRQSQEDQGLMRLLGGSKDHRPDLAASSNMSGHA